MAKTQLREVLWHNAQGLASVQRKEGCAGLLRDVEEGGAPLVGVGLVRVFYEEKSPTNYPQIVTACAFHTLGHIKGINLEALEQKGSVSYVLGQNYDLPTCISTENWYYS